MQSHTYVAGEDEGRLKAAAADLGLGQGEGRLKPTNTKKATWASLLLNDNTLTAARMHSVGTLGADERVDEYGTLHLLSVRKRSHKTMGAAGRGARGQAYQQLTDLFAHPETTTTATTMDVEVEVVEEYSMPISDGPEPPAKKKTPLDYQAEGEDEDDEDEIVDMVEGGSLGAAAFGIVKGTVGPAILYLPRGFYTSGYAVAIPAMLFATFMFIFNSYRLLACWRVESEKNHQIERRLQEVQALLQNAGGGGGGNDPNNHTNIGGAGVSGGVMNPNDSLNIHVARSPKRKAPVKQAPKQQYGAIALEQDTFFQAKLLTYPELAKRALGSYAVFVELGIALFQFGVCLTYLIFVPDNLAQCYMGVMGGGEPPNKLIFLWLMILVEIPLSWIRDIRKLTPTNVLATFLILFGLLAVLVIAFYQGTQQSIEADDADELVFVHNLKSLKPLTETWFLFIGTSFFMMEGSITLLVPLQEAVFRKEDKAQFPNMNRNVTSYICLFYIIFSAIACAAFGSKIQTALTASLPPGSLATLVQLAYSIAVILTFPLQAFPAMEVAIRMVDQIRGTHSSSSSSSYYKTSKAVDWKRNGYATVIVIGLGIIAVCAIDYLGNVVSILGSLFGIPLALVFPPLMHNQLVQDSSTLTRWTNYGVVVIGLFAMAAASYNTIVMWDAGAE